VDDGFVVVVGGSVGFVVVVRSGGSVGFPYVVVVTEESCGGTMAVNAAGPKSPNTAGPRSGCHTWPQARVQQMTASHSTHTNTPMVNG
jgi:hypothetical protein